MKGGETALECARRECYEETGLTLTEEIGYTTMKLSRNRDGNNAEYFRHYVDTELPLNIVDKNEIGSGGWFTLPEMQRLEGNIDVTNFATQNGFPPIR